MPDPGANLWISQAQSDLRGAASIYDANDHRTYCQAIARYQQTVEKAIKAIAAAVRDAGIETVPVSHYYKHDVEKLVSALRHLPHPNDRRDIKSSINTLLNQYHREEITALSQLAPKRPNAGELHVRNTEYPYEIEAGVWTAPALPGAFSQHDVRRFEQLAERIYHGTRQIVSALRRV
jgi:HEPN domain-containing protein